jgi:hypothetical protein
MQARHSLVNFISPQLKIIKILEANTLAYFTSTFTNKELLKETLAPEFKIYDCEP